MDVLTEALGVEKPGIHANFGSKMELPHWQEPARLALPVLDSPATGESIPATLAARSPGRVDEKPLSAARIKATRSVR